MKKLFLLLILSFFSAQGLTASCPDGSEPVRSVSADGTYFVYNCGGGSNKTSTSINSSSTTSASSGNIKKNFEVDSNSSHTLQFKDVYVNRKRRSGWYPGSISYLDLDGDGDTDIFIGPTSPNKNSKQVSEVYLNDGFGSFTFDRDFFANPPAFFSPRKSIIGDYNGDGKEDIYVAGHGWDKPPWSGEAPVLILSSKAGYTTSVLDEYIGFQHGAASADIDADGDLDIVGVITDTPTKSGANYVMMLINDGSGNFVHDKTKLLNLQGRYYTVELVDVDQDGYVDLLLGGFNTKTWKPITEILWGSELGDYSNWNKTILPAVPGYEFALDIDVGDIDNDGDKDMILNRTGSKEGLGSYIGYHVQILKNNGDRSFSQTGSIVSSPQEKWFDWIRLVDIYNDGNLDIIVDDANRNLIWINSGSGSFTQLKNIRNIPGFGTSRKYKSCNGLQCRPCSKNCADLLFLSTEEVTRIIEEEEVARIAEENFVFTDLTRIAEEEIEKEIAIETSVSDNKVTSWWKNGQIKSEENYKDGKLDGKWTMWHENGQIKLEANYKDDKLDGKVTNWNENGQILLELNYKDGKLVSNTNDAARIAEGESAKVVESVETKLDELEAQPEEEASADSKKAEEVPAKKTGIEAWSDASVCLWLKSSGGGHPTPLNEAKKRGISCN